MNRPLLGPVRRDVLDLCDSAVDSRVFMQAAGDLLSRAVPCDAWAMHAVDPATLLPSQGILDCWRFDQESLWHIARREFLNRDVNVFAELSRAETTVSTLVLATAGRPAASARFADFFRPLGVTDELRATFVSNASCWGVSTFLRTGAVPFSAADVRFIFSLAPHIGGALRRLAWVADAVKVPNFTPAIVVLDDRDRIVEATADATAWLAELKLMGPRVERAVPVVVSVVAQQARLQAPMPLPAGDFHRVRTTGGNWVSLRGARLKGSRARVERVAVVIEPAPRDEVADFLLTGYRLSARERQIALLLAHGRASKDVADFLCVSPHTVRDHVKKVFEKLGVHTRAELIAKLFVDAGPVDDRPL